MCLKFIECIGNSPNWMPVLLAIDSTHPFQSCQFQIPSGISWSEDTLKELGGSSTRNLNLVELFRWKESFVPWAHVDEAEALKVVQILWEIKKSISCNKLFGRYLVLFVRTKMKCNCFFSKPGTSGTFSRPKCLLCCWRRTQRGRSGSGESWVNEYWTKYEIEYKYKVVWINLESMGTCMFLFSKMGIFFCIPESMISSDP